MQIHQYTQCVSFTSASAFDNCVFLRPEHLHHGVSRRALFIRLSTMLGLKFETNVYLERVKRPDVPIWTSNVIMAPYLRAYYLSPYRMYDRLCASL